MNARRLAALVAAACALNVSATMQAQFSPAAVRQLAQQLAAKIAASAAPLEEIALAQVNADSPNAVLDRLVQPELVAQLRAHHLSLVPSASDRTASVRATCSRNLRDLVCAADVLKGDMREIVVVSIPAEAAPSPVPQAVGLTIQPLLSRDDRILDIAQVRDVLLVLTPGAVHEYRQSDAGWRLTASQPVAWQSPPPRDCRGRLFVTGDVVDAFLPAMSCRVVPQPLQVSCTQPAAASWPVGIPGSAIGARVNYFTAPKVPPFYAAAAVGAVTPTGWLLAGVDGRLHLLGDTLADGQTWPGIGDDLVSLRSNCGAERRIIIAGDESSEGDGVGFLRAYDFRDSRLVALTPPVPLSGRITAAWEVPGKALALIVVQNRDSGDYDAFYVEVVCSH